MCLNIILKVTKNQGFIHSLEDKFLKNQQEGKRGVRRVEGGWGVNLTSPDILGLTLTEKIKNWNARMLTCAYAKFAKHIKLNLIYT